MSKHLSTCGRSCPDEPVCSRTADVVCGAARRPNQTVDVARKGLRAALPLPEEPDRPASSTDLDAIETEAGVVVESSDEAGQTFVYAYTEAGERISVEFHGMNPPINRVRACAVAVGALRAYLNGLTSG